MPNNVQLEQMVKNNQRQLDTAMNELKEAMSTLNHLKTKRFKVKTDNDVASCAILAICACILVLTCWIGACNVLHDREKTKVYNTMVENGYVQDTVKGYDTVIWTKKEEGK